MAFQRPMLGQRSNIILLLVLVISLWSEAQSQDCTPACGDNSNCQNGTCTCLPDYISPSGLNIDCISLTVPDSRCSQYDSSCVYCGSLFEGPCMRCISNDYFLSGESCVTFCPEGFQITFLSTSTPLSARVCNTGSTPTATTLPQWAVITIAVIVIVIFVLIVMVVLGFALRILTRSSHGEFEVEESNLTDSRQGTLRTHRSNSFSFERKHGSDRDPVTRHNPNYVDEIEGDEETVFHHKLKYLRTQAEVFLKMLNDMRRRLKEIPVESAAAQQYRNVMQDVTRLLYLLNKKPSIVEMPPDGLQLLVWSEKILERYLTSQGITLQKSSNRLSTIGPQGETQF